MATPQSTTSFQGDSEDKKLEQITFRFCSECSNMLYPKEDEEAHKLQFTCRTCQYTEDARSTCVFRNILNNSAGETAGVTQDVGSDPTVSDHCALPVCLHCGVPIMCDTCGASSLEVAASEERCSGRENMDYITAFASNIGWTEEDLFDEFTDFEYEYSTDNTEDTDATSRASELPRSNKTCPRCNHEEAVFFQSQQRSAETGMKLFYVCCLCGHIFS